VASCAPVARWAITGGSGFLGLHLARRLRSRGDLVRTLDVEPLDAELETVGVEAIVGDVRNPSAVDALCREADVVVHAAAALPIQGSAREIRSVNVDGTATVLAAAADAGVRRVLFVSSTAVYGVPKVHPIPEDLPLEPVGAYGSSKIEAENVCREFAARGLEVVVIRPKTFVGPERLGVFEILFDWIRDGRRIYTIGSGGNRYQLLAVEDLVEALLLAAQRPVAGAVFNVGAKEFGTVREDLQALIDHAGSSSRLTPVPARPVQLVLRALELLRVSPLAEWHYKTADKDSYVSIDRAESELGWTPRFSNAETLIDAYRWYEENLDQLARGPGLTHRAPWDQRALLLIKRLS
jgi:nucleoside-diphosphate-sugar epimerase